LDLLFPPVCAGCGAPGWRWCGECQQRVASPPLPLCTLCGIPVKDPGLCADCRRAPPQYTALRSWSVFDSPVRNALHRLKYRRDIGLGDALAAQLSQFALALNWPVTLITPVPLGQSRLKERGYNQVGLIARPLSLAMGISYAPNALARVRETRSQVGLTKMERHHNVRGAFQGNRSRVNGLVALVLDDVATTGSTLSACADALLTAGARDVYALTISRALARHGLESA